MNRITLSVETGSYTVSRIKDIMDFDLRFLCLLCLVISSKTELVQTFSTHSLRYTTQDELITKGM